MGCQTADKGFIAGVNGSFQPWDGQSRGAITVLRS